MVIEIQSGAFGVFPGQDQRQELRRWFEEELYQPFFVDPTLEYEATVGRLTAMLRELSWQVEMQHNSLLTDAQYLDFVGRAVDYIQNPRLLAQNPQALGELQNIYITRFRQVRQQYLDFYIKLVNYCIRLAPTLSSYEMNPTVVQARSDALNIRNRIRNVLQVLNGFQSLLEQFERRSTNEARLLDQLSQGIPPEYPPDVPDAPY